LELRALRQDLEQLVGLLLVLDDREADLGVLEDVGHLRGRRVLVERHRDGAQRLRRGDRAIEARAVGADHGQVLAAHEAGVGEAAGERLDLVANFLPGPRLPDAEVLLAHGRVAAARARVLEEQLRERVGHCGSGGGVRNHGTPVYPGGYGPYVFWPTIP